MFSLLAYKLNIEFWRDIGIIFTRPISELPPRPMIAGAPPLPEPQKSGLKPRRAVIKKKL